MKDVKRQHKRQEKEFELAGESRERIIYGRNPLIELLKFSPKRILRVLVNSNSLLPEALMGSMTSKITVELVQKNELDEMFPSINHQGVVAFVKAKETLDFKNFIKKLNKERDVDCILALDRISDPHNLGAIMRAAECFGIRYIVSPKAHSAGLSPVVSKTSVGASELVDLVEVSNLASALEELKQLGYWIYGTGVFSNSKSINETDFAEKSVIVLGAEGEGMRDLTMKKCDFLVHIPMYGKIDSLNVSQACAVLLNTYRNFRSNKTGV